MQKRRVRGQQFVVRISADADRSGIAVVRLVTEIEIPLQAAERRQHVVPAPTRTPGIGPFFVILRYAAQGNRRVHRTGTSDHAATGQGLALALGRRVVETPVVIPIGIVVTVHEVERQRRKVHIVGTRLQQQHLAVGIF